MKQVNCCSGAGSTAFCSSNLHTVCRSLSFPRVHIVKLTFLLSFYLQTLTIALTTHVRTVHLVWMVSTITHAHVQQDIRGVTVNRVSFFLLLFSLSCCGFIQFYFYYFIIIALFFILFCYSPF